MGPYDSAISAGSSSGSSSSSSSKPHEIDGLLAGAGYKVRSSDLRQVAQRLERLETVMVNTPADVSQLASDAVHYNPSDIASWVDTLLSELNHPVPLPSDLPDFPDLVVSPLNQSMVSEAWTQQHQNISHHQLMAVTATEEDSGIRLVHTLVMCAESVQRGELALAGSLLENMQALLTRVNTGCGIGKVAGYFIDALSCRVLRRRVLLRLVLRDRGFVPSLLRGLPLFEIRPLHCQPGHIRSVRWSRLCPRHRLQPHARLTVAGSHSSSSSTSWWTSDVTANWHWSAVTGWSRLTPKSVSDSPS
ncbi:hypothetical protein FNV43_RR16624 [Rhamnella rubrinervis]|uniref:Transcriptional factor DELLA N-terminal domain-containing protein n=1 Tax=Rhamnella rubrinervis TaxID=2594499 RepID=A0A8K0GZ42_9ROSA|nr:hypothetical protein FNV43_RR16624 [Rhamnella rubrinervis]